MATRGEIRLRELRTGGIAKSWFSHSSCAGAVACHPKDKSFATGGDDGVVRIWGLPTCAEVQHLQLPGLSARSPRPIHGFAFVPKGQKLLIASQSRLDLWDRGSTELTPLLKPGEAALAWPIAASPDGKRVAAWVYRDKLLNYVRLWDSANGKKLFDLARDYADGLVFQHDGRHLLALASGEVVCWDLRERRRVATFNIRQQAGQAEGNQTTDEVLQWTLSPRGDRFATVHANGTVRLWRLRLPKDR